MTAAKDKTLVVDLTHLREHVVKVSTVCSHSSIVLHVEGEAGQVLVVVNVKLNYLVNVAHQSHLHMLVAEKQMRFPRQACRLVRHIVSAVADIVSDLHTAAVECVPSLPQDQRHLVSMVMAVVVEACSVSRIVAPQVGSIL